MKKIAIILTSFNRKDKTIACLSRLYKQDKNGISFDVYLTDDGSSDGTSDEVKEKFPNVIISEGNGLLFWAGGMNLSWNRAIEHGGYDGYLWLNDDTILENNVWKELIEADEYCKKRHGCGGIYIGSTTDLAGQELTYGGSVTTKKWRSVYRRLEPNGKFQECQIGNGNITYVSANVVDKLGAFYPGYIHGADYDYTYWAYKEGFHLLLLKDYVGKCDNDHPSLRSQLTKRNLKERIKFLYSPTGMQLPTALLFQKRFYPHYVPLLLISYWTKAIFPWILKK